MKTDETGRQLSQGTPAASPSADPLRSPVDDRTYNLLQALTSTLEAIDAYELYASGDGQAALFEGLLADERRHAEILLDELRSCLDRSTEPAAAQAPGRESSAAG